jgi:capsular polysaccharide biosynthesis protein
MELRWYWRVLRRQARLIIITTLIVAFLAALYTAYSYYTTQYTAAQTIEFTQAQPIYQTQSINVDPIQTAAGNASAANSDAKLFTEGDSFFKGVSAYLLKFHNKKIDYKSVPVGVTQTGGALMRIDYKSNDSTLAVWAVQAGIYVLQHQFLPVYEEKFRQTVAKGFAQNVFEPQIQINPNFDALNVRTTSKLKEIQAWIVKCLVGLILGVALAFLWEYLDESIHDEQDVRNWMHVPTLGVIPGGKARVA